MCKLTYTRIGQVIVGHHPSWPQEMIEACANEFVEHIRWRQEHPKQPGEEGYDFWCQYMDIDLGTDSPDNGKKQGQLT